MSDIPFEHTSQFAWHKYKDRVTDIIRSFDHPNIIEIGGGRSPLFGKEDLPANVASYTINDILQKELDLAPIEWTKACFDVCSDIEDGIGQYDIAFSKMLAEHVPDGYKFHANLFKLLRPDGICFHFMPILYSPPFVINKILPTVISRNVLRMFFRNRHEGDIPKFSAYYSMCYGTSGKLVKRYESIGYTDVEIETFYGHGYFEKLPVVRELDRVLTKFAYRRGLTKFGSYAYVKVVKPK